MNTAKEFIKWRMRANIEHKKYEKYPDNAEFEKRFFYAYLKQMELMNTLREELVAKGLTVEQANERIILGAEKLCV